MPGVAKFSKKEKKKKKKSNKLRQKHKFGLDHLSSVLIKYLISVTHDRLEIDGTLSSLRDLWIRLRKAK